MSPLKRREADAADWLIRSEAGLTPNDRHLFRDWLSDPRNKAALEGLQAAWRTVHFPGTTGQADVVLARLHSRELRRRRRRTIAAGAAAAAALLLVVLSSPLRPLLGGTRGESSITTLEPGRQVLPDGSTVRLNHDAKIAVEFSGDRRGVRLLRGEALFAVTKDIQRPFVVSAGGVDVRAVGTEFSVRYDPSQVDVLVTEGRVALKRSSDGASLLGASEAARTGEPALDSSLLAAGERAVIPASPLARERIAVTSVSESDISSALAWRRSRVEFSRTPLSRAMAYFNRLNRVQLSTSDSALERLPVTGNVCADDPEGFVRLLETGFNVESARSGDLIVLRLRPR